MDTLWAWNQKLTKRNPDGTYSQAGLVPWVGNWGAPAWIWTFGGKLIDIDGTKVTPTATYHKNVEAFEWLAEWGQFFGTRTPVSAGWGGLRDGKVAMSPESTSVVGRLIDATYLHYRMVVPPGGGNGTWGGGTAIGVPLQCAESELSLKLVRFFGEARVQIERSMLLTYCRPTGRRCCRRTSAAASGKEYLISFLRPGRTRCGLSTM